MPKSSGHNSRAKTRFEINPIAKPPNRWTELHKVAFIKLGIVITDCVYT